MILIPIFFVFFFQRLNKVTAGRKAFETNFYSMKMQALEEAINAYQNQHKPDIEKLSRHFSVPKSLRPQYTKWVTAQIACYTQLLKSKGLDYKSLVHSAYGTKEHFLKITHNICEYEKYYYQALAADMINNVPDAGRMVEKIVHHSNNY